MACAWDGVQRSAGPSWLIWLTRDTRGWLPGGEGEDSTFTTAEERAEYDVWVVETGDSFTHQCLLVPVVAE